MSTSHETPLSSSRTSKRTQRTILVCDDNPDILELCSAILTHAGYTVRVANGYEQFKAQFDPTSPPHVLILDVQMPEHDGFWIAENLGSGVRVPIIFITGHDRPVYRLYAPIAGAFDYLTKPFDPEQLLQRVGKALTIKPKCSSALMPAVDYKSGRLPAIEF